MRATQHEQGLSAPSSEDETIGRASTQALASAHTQVPFVGRTAAVQTLADVVRGSGDPGECPVVLVSGDPGIGKTTLISQLPRMVPGPRYLVGRCMDFGEAPSYAPFVGILRELVRDDGLAELRRELSPSVASALAWLLPDFDEPLAPDSGTRTRMFDAFLSLLEHLAMTSPIVVVVEDVHWADQSTWDLLIFLIGNASDVPMTTIVTYRDLPVGHVLRGPLAELSRLGHVRALPLEGLTREDVELQAAALSGVAPTREQADRLMRLTAGNPLYVEAAVDLMLHAESSASRTRDVLLAPVERLPEDSQLVLRVAAVGGATVLHAALSRVSGMDDAALERALRPAVESRLLVVTHDGYRFRHDLIGTLVYDEMLLPGERTRLHRAFAQAIDQSPELAPPVTCHAAGEVARHWKSAGEPLLALAATWKAAQEGRNLLAHPERLRMLQGVLELWAMVDDPGAVVGVSRAVVLHDAVEAAEESGDCELGLAFAGDALAAAVHDGEVVLAAAVLERRSRLRAQMGIAGSAADLEEALNLLPDGPGPLRGRLMAQLADRLRFDGDPDRAETIAEESLTAAHLADDEYGRIRARLAKLSTLAEKDSQSARDGLVLAREAASSLGSPVLEAAAAFALADAASTAGDKAAAAEVARQGVRRARSAGLESTLGSRLATVLVGALFATGRWDEASEALAHALELDPPPGYRTRLLALKGDLDLACGRDADAIVVSEEIARLRASHARWADLETEVAAETLHIRLELNAGHDESAMRSALQCAAAWPPSYAPRSAWPLVVSAAMACRRADVESGGVGAASVSSTRDTVADIASRLPTSGPESYAWMCSLAAEIATPETRLTARDKELSAWEKADQPWQIGWALVRSAYGLLGASRRPEAAERLRRAVDIADSLGAAPLREAAAKAASRARLSIEPEEPKAVPDTPGHGLTPRETEVLGLLCQGRTNRQIGEELFISAKTASIHVSRILMKLAVANRGEAAAEAHRLGIVEQPKT